MSQGEGQPVQVVKIKDKVDGSCFELNEAAIRQIVLQNDIKDLPVVVVSVAGKMRQGKSFLLSLAIRYLKSKYADLGDKWLGDEEAPLSGFKFRAGPQFCTSGILIWSEVFILHGPVGEKIAVLLMDTQGTYDTSATMKECSTVFALSTMISSIQIYNVMMDIKRDDLDSLQLFVEYGRAAHAQGREDRPFKALHFLVRDWQWAESHGFGEGGGAEYLKAKLQTEEGVRLSFEEVSCVLLPYPWKTVATKGRAEGDLRELGDEFKKGLKEYFDQIFSWDHLQTMVKVSAGENMKAKEILSQFKVYVGIFQQNKVPTPQSAFQANAHVVLTTAYEMGLKSFEDIKKSLIGSIVDEKTPVHDPQLLQETLKQCQEHALRRFESRVALSNDEEMAARYHERLRQDVETISQSIIQLNNVKLINEEAQKTIKAAEVERTEAETKKRDTKKLIKELKKEKFKCEQQRRYAVRGKKQAKEELLAAERHAEERLKEAELQLQEAIQLMYESDAKRQKAEEKLKKHSTRTSILCAVRVVGGVLLTAASYVNPVAALVTNVVKPIFDAAFPLLEPQGHHRSPTDQVGSEQRFPSTNLDTRASMLHPDYMSSDKSDFVHRFSLTKSDKGANMSSDEVDIRNRFSLTKSDKGANTSSDEVDIRNRFSLTKSDKGANTSSDEVDIRNRFSLTKSEKGATKPKSHGVSEHRENSRKRKCTRNCDFEVKSGSDSDGYF